MVSCKNGNIVQSELSPNSNYFSVSLDSITAESTVVIKKTVCVLHRRSLSSSCKSTAWLEQFSKSRLFPHVPLAPHTFVQWMDSLQVGPNRRLTSGSQSVSEWITLLWSINDRVTCTFSQLTVSPKHWTLVVIHKIPYAGDSASSFSDSNIR